MTAISAVASGGTGLAWRSTIVAEAHVIFDRGDVKLAWLQLGRDILEPSEKPS
jgi:hypothetical protein